jgi:ATP-dependent RNA helicase RhlE
MSQWQRQEAMDGFRDGSLKILVATDIARRGLDVLSITHVINYDMPDTTDAYTHRIGRAGESIIPVRPNTLVTNEDKEMIQALERIFKKPIETRQLEGFDYTAEATISSESMPSGSKFSRSRSPVSNKRRLEQSSGTRFRNQERRPNSVEKQSKSTLSGPVRNSTGKIRPVGKGKYIGRERISVR